MEASARVVLVVNFVVVAAIFAGTLGRRADDDSVPRNASSLPEVPTATLREFPDFGFRVTIPDGWEVRTGVDSVSMFLPGTNANMGFAPNPGCLVGTLAQAVSALRSHMTMYSTYTGYQVLEEPAGRTIDGHAAADALISHFLADGRAFQQLAVILGPDLSTVWTFSGLMHNASEVSLRPTINETLGSFDAFDGMSPTRYRHPARPFLLDVPPAWNASTNASLGGGLVDVALTAPRNEVTFLVVSENYTGPPTYEAAREILQEVLAGLSDRSGFQTLEPIAPVNVDGHTGAQAAVTWQPSTYGVVQVIAIVLAPEWHLSWGLIGTMFDWDAPFARSCVTLAVASFDILGEPAVGPLAGFGGLWTWIILVVAAAAAVFVVGYFRIRDRRRPPIQPLPPPAPPTPPM